MKTETQAPQTPTQLAAGEADLAGRAVFAWVLVPAAGRLVRELAEGHEAHDAVAELRAAVRLLDRVGWPDGPSTATRLTPGEAAVVRVAARSQLGRGVNPDRAARRIARGPAARPLARRDAVAGLLAALEQPPP